MEGKKERSLRRRSDVQMSTSRSLIWQENTDGQLLYGSSLGIETVSSGGKEGRGS